MFISYHRQVESGRIPNGTEWDEQRAAAEAAINPYCFKDINYAALSLDYAGMRYYGDYAVVIKSLTIEDRASIFEENPFYFNKKHHVYAGSSPPAGYKASWSERDRLAVAKLHSRLNPGATAVDFPNVLMEQKRDQADCDFIEVHIYGPVSRVAIDLVTGPKPSRRADVAIWRQTVRVLRELGTQVQEIT
jgi:hypothetical protein